MSTFKVEVVRIDNIFPHPNADRLDICKVKGWQCVSGKGDFNIGQLAVYIPIDSVLPEELVKNLNLTNYKKRLRSIKLRGMLSQGLLISLPSDNLAEGEDVSNILGITKYEEPIPTQMAGVQLPNEPRFVRYTDIENYKNYLDTFEKGESIVVTEKIHGTNFRAAKIDGKLFVGSHRLNLKESDTNLYWRAAKQLNLAEKLLEGEQLFGEIYGKGIQDLAYGKKPGEIHVAVFDLMKDNKYVDYTDFLKIATERNFEVVPALACTEWSDDIKLLAQGNSTICSNQIKEGVVIRPLTEGFSEKLQGRKIIKIINDDYLLKEGRTDFH
jgi:RNA ligase (TIGR02306 family)